MPISTPPLPEVHADGHAGFGQLFHGQLFHGPHCCPRVGAEPPCCVCCLIKSVI